MFATCWSETISFWRSSARFSLHGRVAGHGPQHSNHETTKAGFMKKLHKRPQNFGPKGNDNPLASLAETPKRKSRAQSSCRKSPKNPDAEGTVLESPRASTAELFLGDRTQMRDPGRSGEAAGRGRSMRPLRRSRQKDCGMPYAGDWTKAEAVYIQDKSRSIDPRPKQRRSNI